MTKKTRIPLSGEMIRELASHQERTRVGATALLNGCREELPAGLHPATIYNWLDGKAKSVGKEQFEYVLKLWECIPGHAEPKGIIRMKQAARPPFKRITNGYIDIDYKALELLKQFQSEKLLPSALFKLGVDIPGGLSPSLISAWLAGGTKRANKYILDYVLSECEKLRAHPQRPVVITDEIWAELKSHRDRSGMSFIALSKLKGDEAPPEGFSYSMLNGWLNKTAQTTQKNYLDFVLSLYSSCDT